jgi:hypothetical protein
VALTSVTASYIDTAIHADGNIANKQGQDGKFTSLDFTVRDGHIQDLLRMFVSDSRPPMSGITNFQAHITVPPDGKPFLKEVTLQGDFDVSDGRFESGSRQESVDQLSATARGDKKAKETQKNAAPADDVTSHLRGHVDLRGGVATFKDLLFSVPGADARMNGTFNLLNEKIDLHGTVRMDAKFSQSTSGIKAAFAKVLNPFLDKKHGSVVPVLVDGTYANPHFGIDLNPVKK